MARSSSNQHSRPSPCKRTRLRAPPKTARLRFSAVCREQVGFKKPSADCWRITCLILLHTYDTRTTPPHVFGSQPQAFRVLICNFNTAPIRRASIHTYLLASSSLFLPDSCREWGGLTDRDVPTLQANEWELFRAISEKASRPMLIFANYIF